MINLLTYYLTLPFKLIINRIIWFRKPLITKIPNIDLKSNIFDNGRIKQYNNELYLHGHFSYLNRQIGNYDEKVTQATAAYVNQIGRSEEGFYTVLASSYNVDNNGNYDYTTIDSQEEDLLGFMVALINDESILLREKYEFLLNSILQNDYSLVNLDKSKSKHGQFNPSWKINAHKMATILAFLKLGIPFGMKDAKIHYNKLRKIGYGLFKSNNTIANHILGKK